MYHVAIVNERTGAWSPMTATPLQHGEACTFLRKCAPCRVAPGYLYQLQEMSGWAGPLAR